MKPIIVAIALITSLIAAPTISQAASSGGSSSTTTTSDFDSGKAAADSGDYAVAIVSLDKAVEADSNNADAYNLLGFSHRKLGNVEMAFENYNQALAINSKHRGANEYIGELYLELDQLDKAEEHLDRLGRSCFFACGEYKDLKEEVDEYKASHGG